MILARIARVVAIILIIGFTMAAVLAWRSYTTPLPLQSAPFPFEVRPGASLSSIARELELAGVLPHPWALTGLARIRSVDRSIKAGNYELVAPLTLPQLLDKLTQGDVTQASFMIVEGVTFAELKRALRGSADIKNTVLDLPDSELMTRLGATGKSPEGLFFPDTYFFAVGTPDFAVLQRAYRAMDARLAAAWSQRGPDLPFDSPYEALILASIVEKETGRASDRPLIASVFVNRLRKGMRLQTDPTVIYGMGDKFDGNLRKRDLETDTPWNTYMRDGLPPTPIALVSQASIDAVLTPPTTEYLYFVARGDGTSQFSSNLVEHNRAVTKFQKGGR